MPREKERLKEPKIRDAAITEDGCLLVTFNQKVYPHTADAIFTPEALLSLVEEYGEIPPASEADFPGIPVVDEEAIFDEDDDDGEPVKKKSKKEEE